MERFNLTEQDQSKLVQKQKLSKPKHLTLKQTRSGPRMNQTMLLADMSGSMAGQKMISLKSALESVWSPGVKCIGFESELWEIQQADIHRMSAMGGTDMFSALMEAWKSGCNHFVLMTDGQPTGHGKAAILAEVVRNPEIPIDTVGIGDKGAQDYDPEFLKEISRLTGGRFTDVGEPVKLTATLKHLLEYKPTGLNEPKQESKGVIQL